MELNALPVTSAADLLSLINFPGDSPIVSTTSSTSSSQDFSALLTEMTGAGGAESASSPEANRQMAPVSPIAAHPDNQPASAAGPPFTAVGAVYDRALN